MPYRVVFAPEVSDQLEALFLYIAERSSPTLAEGYTNAVWHRDVGAALIAAFASAPARRPAPQPGDTLRASEREGWLASPREGWQPVRGETLGL